MIFLDALQLLAQIVGVHRRNLQVKNSNFAFPSNISMPSLHVSKSGSVGDASLCDRHFVTNRRSGLTQVVYCSLQAAALNKACSA